MGSDARGHVSRSLWFLGKTDGQLWEAGSAATKRMRSAAARRVPAHGGTVGVYGSQMDAHVDTWCSKGRHAGSGSCRCGRAIKHRATDLPKACTQGAQSRQLVCGLSRVPLLRVCKKASACVACARGVTCTLHVRRTSRRADLSGALRPGQGRARLPERLLAREPPAAYGFIPYRRYDMPHP